MNELQQSAQYLVCSKAETGETVTEGMRIMSDRQLVAFLSAYTHNGVRADMDLNYSVYRLSDALHFSENAPREMASIGEFVQIDHGGAK